MRLRAFVGLISVAMLASCQTSDGTPPSLRGIKPGRPYSLIPVEYSTINLGVRSRLKDPDSAQLSGIEASEDNGIVSACGYVNAKNSFGGYTGSMPFAGMFATNGAGERVFLVSGIGDGGSGSAAILILCRKKGMPI